VASGDHGVDDAVNPPLRFALKFDPSHPYLAARGLAPETIATFGLGYCTRGTMAGRIAIPIHNERGELVAYAGRWPGEDWPEGEDKYKLPDGFQKRHVLFNLHRCLDQSDRVPGELVLVEGYVAAMQLFARGFPAVALMGRTLSPEQLVVLQSVGARWVTLLLDGDAPGRQSAAALVPLLARSFFVRDVVLDGGQQPDELDEPTLRALLVNRHGSGTPYRHAKGTPAGGCAGRLSR
jgi:DNA primase